MNIAWTTSIYLTVMLSFERFLFFCHPNVAERFCTHGKTIVYIILIAIFAVCYNIPRFIEYKLGKIRVRTDYDPNFESDDFYDDNKKKWTKLAYTNVTMVSETKLLSNTTYVSFYLTWLNLVVRFIIPTTLLVFCNCMIFKNVSV